MLPSEQFPTLKTTLLSAANIASKNESGAMALVGGQPLLAHQIAALHAIGISRFLIEVDSVPGELLALADRYRDMGCSVEFVRSAADLQNLLGTTEQLAVQAESLFLAPDVLRHLLAEKVPYLLTVDGRDENAAFERMDLNTRWAGWAILEARTIASLGPLPDGWSVTSSLLRQAIQDRVRMAPLPQQSLQEGHVRLIRSTPDAEILSRQMLARRARRFGGFIESKIIAPIASRLAPFIWRSSSGLNLVDGATIMSSGGSLALAGTGWTMSALAVAVVATVLGCLRATLRAVDQEMGFARAVQPMSWLLLSAAAIAAGYDDFSYSSDGAYGATVMVGLLLLAQQLNLPVWAQNVLKSPALVAIIALLITPLLGFAQAVRWISLGQLAALIVAKWAHSFTVKKPKQA